MKAVADQVARQFATGPGAAAVDALRVLQDAQAVPAVGTTSVPGDQDRVGIWRRAAGDGVFVRDPDRQHEWHLWANVGRIPPKGAARRIVFLGESVARGYLYDPAYNPSSVLTSILESWLGAGAVEVVDLARVSIEAEISTLAVQAAALEPDLVVMFCGNNWGYPARSTPSDAAQARAALAADGVPGLREHADAACRATAEAVVDEVSACLASRGVPLLWIVPEYNLEGWRDPAASAPHLAGSGNRRWLAHRAAATQALTSGDLVGAATAAAQMLELDRGTSAAGHYVLAECELGGGESERRAARRVALEAARDASIWDHTIELTPRASGTVCEVLRSRPLSWGDRILDSAELFGEHLGGEIPGHQMFLDYCHLSAEGIRVTMAGCASMVLDLLGAAAPTWPQLLPLAPRAGAEVESEARFLAAVYSAHWWQEEATIERHLVESLALSAHIAPVMSAFVEQQVRPIPPMLAHSAETILERGSQQIQQFLFGREHQCLDAPLCAMIVRLLRGAGLDDVPDLQRLLLDEHSPEHGQIDLLSYYYLSTAVQPHETEWTRTAFEHRDRDYFKAYSPTSRFCFVGDPTRAVQLDLTWRLPHAQQPEESVVVHVNENLIGTISGSVDWTRHAMSVPRDLVRTGVNEVSLAWPTPAFPGDAAIRAASEILTSDGPLDLYCSFGDICSFTVRDAGSTR